MRKSLVWVGRFRGISGFAQSTREYAKAVHQFYPKLVIAPLSILEPDDPLFPLVQEPSPPVLEVINHLPTTNPWAQVFFSVYEYRDIPSDWVEIFQQASLIFTQSRFCKEIFSRHLDEKDKVIVAPYIIPEAFQPEGSVLRFTPPSVFTIGSVFEWIPRKQPYRLIRAFLEEFSLDESVALYLRTYNYSFSNLHAHLKECGFDFPEEKLKRVQLIHETLSDMSAFYRGLDCYASPTAGEGFGQTLCEAMACGVPTLGSNHSGNLEFMTQENSYLVDVEEWSQVDGQSDQWWKRPKIASIRKYLRQVYENWQAGTPDPKVNKALELHDRLTPAKIGRLIYDNLKPLLN